jgi:peptidoglycan/LPS O-acetylase OafA/YrhL
MRIKRLDILRCVAILLVIAHHANIFNLTTRVGWVGVDLFFVLSGFLISGLLYSEYKKRQSVDFRRFFIRRGFKIYPPFYILVLATFVAQVILWHAPHQPFSSFLPEILFYQNYNFGIFTHTWSLAVEEHFYMALAVLIAILVRISPQRTDPFRAIPRIFVILAVACLSIRILTVHLYPVSSAFTPYAMNLTHTRIDGLFFGVFLGYLYHFRPEIIKNLLRHWSRRIILAVVTALLLSTCYWFSRDDHFLLTFGLTLLYLGFGALLVLCLEVQDLLHARLAAFTETLGTASAYVGTHSYSIYLWHTPFLIVAPIFLRKVLGLQLHGWVLMGICLVGSCALGILLANLIEFPILHFRDRLFPKRQSSPGDPPRILPAHNKSADAELPAAGRP